MDIILGLVFLGMLGIAVSLVAVAYLICQQIDYHIALYQYGRKVAQQQRQNSVKVVEIRIS